MTNRSADKIELIEKTLNNMGLLRDYKQGDQIKFTSVVELDLAAVEPCVSGPKRPQDRVTLSDIRKDFRDCVPNKPGFKGFGVPVEKSTMKHTFKHNNNSYTLSHGSVVLAAITSCTNTSNPDVMLAAGLVAKNAIKHGLKYNIDDHRILPYIKTSLSPGSGVVTEYLNQSGLTKYLD